MEMDITYFKKLHYDVSRRKYIIDPREDDDNTYMIPDIKRPNCTEADLFDCYDIEGYLSRTNQSIELSRLARRVTLTGNPYYNQTKLVDVHQIRLILDSLECIWDSRKLFYNRRDLGIFISLTQCQLSSGDGSTCSLTQSTSHDLHCCIIMWLVTMR